MPYRLPPIIPLSKREPLTPAVVQQLRDHAERTATASARLLRGAKDKPPGLKATMVDSWLRGTAVSAKPEYVAYVLARWSVLPTKRRMPLTPEMSATLNGEMVRTGLGPVTVLRGARDCPPDLTHQVVGAWAAQTVNTVGVDQWDYLVARLRGRPEASAPARSHLVQRPMREVIEEGELAELRLHRERTGIGGGILLRGATDKPLGLTPTMISGWLSGRSKVANPDHVAYVLARYRAWP